MKKLIKIIKTGAISLCLTALTACSIKTQPKPPIHLICPDTIECEPVKMKLRTNADLLGFSLRQKAMLKNCQIKVDTLQKCLKINR
ncbi:Rz1-like lysis system protein LysC [Actinobacillus delphinicola]|uniref:Rz1-like lysis system protein LysC n=1 Tax=Actinobacillus delphinicola TaxID=51161 RepID=UPI003C73D27E